MHQIWSRRGLLIVVSGLAIALAGCGSSSKSSSSSTTSSTNAATTTAAAMAHPKPIPAVASPSGAVSPRAAGLARLHRVSKGFSAHLAGLGKLPLTQAIPEVSGDINHFWSQEFANSNVQWPQMQEVLVDQQPVQTQCSARATIAPTDPWYLCDGQQGGTFYWTVPWIQQNIATDQGGVNLAFNMAEMWSFHIQNLFGFTNQLEQGQMQKGQWAQQTMCLTGIYVKSLNDRKLFEQGDQQVVQSFLSALNNVNGITAPDVSAQQLQQAFATGAQSGDPSQCGIGNGGGGSTTTSTTTSTNPGLSTTTTP